MFSFQMKPKLRRFQILRVKRAWSKVPFSWQISVNCGADRRNKSAFFLDSSGGVRLGPEPCSNRIFTSQVVNVLTHIAVIGLNLRHQTSVVSMHMILSLSGMIRTHTHDTWRNLFPRGLLLFSKWRTVIFENPRGEDPGDKVAHGALPRNKRRETLRTRLGVLWSPRAGEAKRLASRRIILPAGYRLGSHKRLRKLL